MLDMKGNMTNVCLSSQEASSFPLFFLLCLLGQHFLSCASGGRHDCDLYHQVTAIADVDSKGKEKGATTSFFLHGHTQTTTTLKFQIYLFSHSNHTQLSQQYVQHLNPATAGRPGRSEASSKSRDTIFVFVLLWFFSL